MINYISTLCEHLSPHLQGPSLCCWPELGWLIESYLFNFTDFLQKRLMFHSTFRIFLFSLICQCVYLAIMLIYYGKYGSDGRENFVLKTVGLSTLLLWWNKLYEFLILWYICPFQNLHFRLYVQYNSKKMADWLHTTAKCQWNGIKSHRSPNFIYYFSHCF